MAIIAASHKRVIVQGITGREGLSRARLMLDYGTQVVGGVTPGKGGQEAAGVPVFDSVKQACAELGNVDISVLFIPAPLVRSAALEAIDAGIKTLVIVPDRVPVYDVLEIDAAARQHGARFVGPNTLGVLSPEQAVLGMMGGRAAAIREWAFAGPVGITSRSGGITTSMAYYLARAGIGVSTAVHVGGDSIVGMPHARVLGCSSVIRKPASSSCSARSAPRRKKKPPTSSSAGCSQAADRLHRRQGRKGRHAFQPRRRDHRGWARWSCRQGRAFA
ncbi:MAG: hypothetical protein HND48_15745 [Chloroflexi bacterium]|nr:hypothetical protein [Chloroflexota bacterium]